MNRVNSRNDYVMMTAPYPLLFFRIGLPTKTTFKFYKVV